MKLKIAPLLTIVCFLLFFLLLKISNGSSIILLFIALILDYFIRLNSGIKHLLYFIAVLSLLSPVFYIFLVFLPFAIFGILLNKKNFITNYVIGFAISFIPSTIIYLISTYFSFKLNLYLVAFIFYLLPFVAILFLRKKTLDCFEFDAKDLTFALIVLFFTSYVASGIIDDKNLFMANSSREFYRIRAVVDGILNFGRIPIYDPTIGMGEATYLWVPGAFTTHAATSFLFLRFLNPILMFNALSFFILLMSLLILGNLFISIMDKEKTALNMTAITTLTLITGLNFLFLQWLESFKGFYTYPLAHLLLSLILTNPSTFNEFGLIIYISSLVLTVHSSVGLAIFLFSASMLLLIKFSYLKSMGNLKELFRWIASNKLKIAILIVILVLLPLYFIATPIIFEEFLLDTSNLELNLENVKSAAIGYLDSYKNIELHYLSIRYPNVNRNDDHKFGFFLSIFGPVSLIITLVLFKIKSLHNFRIFFFSYAMHIFAIAAISIYAFRVGGFFRTPAVYLVVLLGASILSIICLFRHKYIKLILIALAFTAFLHSLPYAQSNINNIHREPFMSGEIYKEDLEFIRKLPTDGRIMSYGLFNNVVDYGISHLTGKYASRSERIELQVWRTPHEKIHGQNSFGEPELVLPKSGTEISNYLILGGYRYLYMNICHPIGRHVFIQLYPNFTTPLYQSSQDNCRIIFFVNDSHYSEKIQLSKNVSESKYKEKDGYRFYSISDYYEFNHGFTNFTDEPKMPEPLNFERLSPSKIRILGNFNNNDFVVFKEQYFPRWHAFMNGQEVPVYATNNELILIRTIKGKEIILEYSVLKIEKILGSLSLIGFLSLGIFLIVLIK